MAGKRKQAQAVGGSILLATSLVGILFYFTREAEDFLA